MDSQAQLEFAKCDAADKDSQMACMNKTIDKLHDEMQKLSEEIRLLKTSKCNVEREKDYYMVLHLLTKCLNLPLLIKKFFLANFG